MWSRVTEGEDDEVERLHRLKSALDLEIDVGNERGRVACPNCPHDGDWRTEPGGWMFSCGECGARVDGKFPGRRVAN
jgi:hypothetical protein